MVPDHGPPLVPFFRMLGDPIFSFDSPRGLWVALGLTALAAIVAVVRRPDLPRLSTALLGLGALVLSLAAGLPIWNAPARQHVAVMVDLSPSTRTAEYRDRTFLDRRIHELLRTIPYEVRYFSNRTTDTAPGSTRLADLPADRTVYIPPHSGAVLLFSDCRFELPRRGPATYVVVDPGLEDTEDASITNLEIRGNEVAVTVNNPGSSRRLMLSGVAGPMPATAPVGSMVITRPLAPHATRVLAELSPGDAWPENDALSAIPPPPGQFERWWVGGSNPGPDWRVFSPASLPTDPAEYLAPAVIVLEDLSASDLSDTQQQRLAQYLRDVGGGVVILGGARAFAAGAYEGTTLDSISPLASDPPGPTTHWILLADASGSMSAQAGESTRWNFVTEAVARLLPHLPAHDIASLGSFAEKLSWWVQARPLEQIASAPLPPPGSYPHGPTNLQPALESIARSTDGKMPVQLLVLSDFDTQISDPARLAATLRSKNIRLHLLAIGEGTALPALRGVSAQTGGIAMTQLDPARWAASVRELARAAAPKRTGREPLTIHFADDASSLKPQLTSEWNRVWVKDSAVKLADARHASDMLPMAARWNVGEGQALAAAFDPPADQVGRLADLVARPPHDPRFRVSWETAGHLRVVVDAQQNGEFLNDQQLTLELSEPSAKPGRGRLSPVPQTAPGRYELTLPAARSPGLATVRALGRVIGRIAVAGRYAPEFEAVGNDHAAMDELARRSGGQVVAPEQTTPLDIHWPPHPTPLTSPLAMAAGLLIALGLIWWRMSS